MSEGTRKEKTQLGFLSEQVNRVLRGHRARGAGRDQWANVEKLDHLVLERKETKVENEHVYVLSPVLNLREVILIMEHLFDRISR